MKKIMFSDRFKLTDAVLEERKTQTRRLVPENEFGDFVDVLKSKFCLYKKGEIVAVAQSYHTLNESGYIAPEWCEHKCESSAGYENKMFVKADLMPHRIKIIDVRVQSLQDITDEDCLLEGIEKEERKDGGYNYIFFDSKRNLYIRERTPRDAYARLIDAISGKGTWESNQYFFVYDFELVK